MSTPDRHDPRWLAATADALSAMGLTPNAITWLSLVLAIAAAVCLVLGAGDALPWSARDDGAHRSYWPLVAAVLLLASAMLDLLDGIVARRRGMASTAGALLDSTLDRVSELVVLTGCAIHFAMVGNVTLVALSLLAFGAGSMISYIKARGENFVDGCGVGAWRRGERAGYLFVAALVGHVPASLWMLTVGPALTAWRRMRYASALVRGQAPPQPPASILPIMIWRHRPGSPGYFITGAIAIAFVIAAPWLTDFFSTMSDPLGDLLRR